DKQVTAAVTEIIEAVRDCGDEAVRAFTMRFDGACPDTVEVGRDEINDALTMAEPEFVNALLAATEHISAFHLRQKQQSFIDTHDDGVMMGQRIRGLARVGLYVPG
ncbi:histidinol dehydrogenase, partial [Anaerotruncus colihominis]|uniref:histidinol dehydrogenase n=1 Tax=Anaerotruncus colihominis TaxID=169435 RepID=UPI00210F13A8